MKGKTLLRDGLYLLVAVGLPVATTIASLSAAEPAKPKAEITAVLIYELDRGAAPDAKEGFDRARMEKIVEVLERRVKMGNVIIRPVEDKRIEVLIVGAGPEAVEQVQKLVERAGTLEFRVLANDRDQKELIQRAKKEDLPVLRSKVKNDKGEYPVLAWWVPLGGSERLKDKAKRDAAEEKLDVATKERLALDRQRVTGLLSYPEICKRTVRQGDKEIDQVLVVKDDQDVTGQYLADASEGTDSRGRPCVNFRFNEDGAKRLSNLTKSNLPEPDGAFTRKLGIIIDGRLFSAPSIRSTISDRGEITGEFTQNEIQDLAAMLNAGSLPVKMKLIEKRVDK